MFYFSELARLTLYYIGVKGKIRDHYNRHITKLKYYLRWMFYENYYKRINIFRGNENIETGLCGDSVWRLHGPAKIECYYFPDDLAKELRVAHYYLFSTSKNKIMKINTMSFHFHTIKKILVCPHIVLTCEYLPNKSFGFNLLEDEVDMYKICESDSEKRCGHCVWPLPREYLR